MSDSSIYENRERICDLGFLRQAYRRENGALGWRCSGERTASYIYKGGDMEDTVGRKCVCNGLLANVGLGQSRRQGQHELPLVTCGNDLQSIAQFFPVPGAEGYSALDVVERLLSGVRNEAAR